MGIGANFNCYDGVIPDEPKLTELTGLAKEIESRFNIELPIVWWQLRFGIPDGSRRCLRVLIICAWVNPDSGLRNFIP